MPWPEVPQESFGSLVQRPAGWQPGFLWLMQKSSSHLPEARARVPGNPSLPPQASHRAQDESDDCPCSV